MDPLHSLTLGDLARENRRNWPQATATVDGAIRLTFPELDDRVNQLANALVAEGVEPGDRVLWLGQNSFRVLESLLAAAKVGAVLCPANWRQSASELRFVIDDLAPRVVFWQQADIGEAVAEARDTAETKALWVRHDAAAGDEGSYEALLASGSTTDPQVAVDPHAPVLALYTAAFDGTPNAALLSHAALIDHNMSLALARQMEPGFAYLDSGPLFHVGTMMFCLATFHLGGKNVFLPTFTADEAARLIDAERCDGAFLFGPMVDQMVEANSGGKYDLKCLRAPAGKDEWNAMITVDDSPWHRAFYGYGQTEVGGMLTFAGYGVGGAGSSGRPSPLAQVRILDPAGNEAAAGEIGEIVARGHVTNGYHNRPDLNAARQAGGWHHTGDLGRRESDGTLSFLGPKLRLIKSAAENIYPVEVEKALTTHPAVAECAVIGQPDEQWGQSVVAIVVLAPDATASAEELIEHCRQSIASYKKPRRVEFTDALPKRGYSPDYDALDAQYGGGGYPGT
jgi:long-chain acyl-CoA synthetase